MADLETRLRALELDWPATPDLAARVERALHTPSNRLQLGGRRRALALALAVLALATAGVLAVSEDARTAVLRFFQLRGATVELVDELPPVEVIGEPYLGERLSRADAERRAGFALRDAGLLGEPDAVYAFRTVVSFVYGERPTRAILSQVRGGLAPEFFKKSAAEVEPVRVGDGTGVWVPGPHFFMWVSPSGELHDAPPYLAGSTLLFEQGGLTFRLEGDFTLAQAVEIAESVE